MMIQMRRGALSLAVLTIVAVVCGAVTGAIAATPISSCGTTITAPGSYVLTQDLVVVANCLIGAADHVTIGLNVFVIEGCRELSHDGHGVWDAGVGRNSIAVRNGTIKSFTSAFDVRASTSVRVDQMIVTENFVAVELGKFIVRDG